jgi:hypothetical protein
MLQTFNITAGGRQIDTKATFFRYESVNGGGLDETIRVRADNNDLGTYMPGDEVRIPVAATRWEVVPVSPTLTPIVRLGIGQVSSSRIAGTVRVVDQGADKTRGMQQFITSISSVANAGLLSVVGIAPQTVPIAIKRLALSSATAGFAGVYVATGQGTANPSYPIAPKNKLMGGVGSTARTTTGNCALSQPTAGEVPGAAIWFSLYVPANSVVEVPMTTPMVLNPGSAIIAHGGSINRDLIALFDYEELS